MAQRIIQGLREALEHATGTPSGARVTVKSVPNNVDVRAIRQRLGLSQEEFALRFGVSVGTIRHWEQGRRYPDGPARVLLRVIDDNPEAVERALAVG